MELIPRHTAFLVSEMEAIENSDARMPSEKHEARQIREKAEVALTESPR